MVGTFPPLMLLQHYLTLAMEHATEKDLLGHGLDDLPVLPFSTDKIPRSYPAPADLRLHVDGTKDD